MLKKFRNKIIVFVTCIMLLSLSTMKGGTPPHRVPPNNKPDAAYVFPYYKVGKEESKMDITMEILEDTIAQRFDDEGNIIEEVVIPKGSIITMIDMGSHGKIISPEVYKGLVFTHGYYM